MHSRHFGLPQIATEAKYRLGMIIRPFFLVFDIKKRVSNNLRDATTAGGGIKGLTEFAVSVFRVYLLLSVKRMGWVVKIKNALWVGKELRRMSNVRMCVAQMSSCHWHCRWDISSEIVFLFCYSCMILCWNSFVILGGPVRLTLWWNYYEQVIK